MEKQKRIYELAVPATKDKSISVRMTAKEYDELNKKAQTAGLNRSDYIKAACLSSKIETIPGAERLAKELHSFHMKISRLPQGKIANTLLDKISQRLINFLNEKA